MAGLRGLESYQEQKMSQLIRDTRTIGQRINDFFKSPQAVAVALFVLAIGSLFLPAIADIAFISGIVTFLVAFIRKATLPFRMPMRAHELDYNDLKPGSQKPVMSRGIYFFGNEKRTKQELWFNNEDMRTHVLIFGSTGSGKTEFLVSLAYNALVQGSGFIYVDGKGDNSLFAKIFSMCRYMGREDDLLLVNFMTGAKDIIGPQKTRLSNTLNPFSSGSSSMLSQLVISLMESSSQSSDGDMWKGRAIAFVEALMKVLVAMRDTGHILLDANTIRNYFTLDRLEAMVMDKVFIRDHDEPMSLEGLPSVVMEPITNYLFNLPGYNKEKKGKQVSQVLEQHGFITMQLTRVFSSLADTYGHILRTNLAEVDLRDVVLNRRILVVLLPALEKSPDELSNLGKVIIATLKAMMASGLGESVEGEYHDLVSRKPTNSPTPYLCILDEYGYYAVEGFAVVPAQARSLGFSVVFAGQDLPAFQKASKEEAASIGANTNIKMCMKLEDPTETWEFFSKTAGESYVMHTSGYQSDTRSVMNYYRDNQGAQLEKRARLDLLDLKEQGLGEVTIFFKSKIVRARTFFTNPRPTKVMRLNQFVKVDQPSDAHVKKLLEGMRDFETKVEQEDLFTGVQALSADLETIIKKMREDTSGPAIERGVSALLAFTDRDKPHEETYEVELPADELNLFTPLRMNDYLKSILLETSEQFAAPLLEYQSLRRQTEYLERLLGRTDHQASEISSELLKDMQMVTHYPPEIMDKPEPEELAETVNTLVDHMHLRQSDDDEGGSSGGSDDDIEDITDFGALPDLSGTEDTSSGVDLPPVVSDLPTDKPEGKSSDEEDLFSGLGDLSDLKDLGFDDDFLKELGLTPPEGQEDEDKPKDPPPADDAEDDKDKS